MDLRRRNRILAAGKSPSTECMKRTYNRAVANGGMTQDFSTNVENIREIIRKLSYTDGNKFFNEAPFVYVPSSYGEGKNFAQVQNKRNLFQWSNDYAQAIWFKGSPAAITVNANTLIAPDGTTTATKITETTVSGPQILQHGLIPYMSNSIVSMSISAKAVDRNYILIGLSNQDTSNYVLKIIDLTNGTVANTSTNGVVNNQNVVIINQGNGWFRIVLTGSFVGTGLSVQYNIKQTPTFTNYAGATGFGIGVYGAQLEAGAYATPYQKTVAAGDGIVDFNFTRATPATVTNKQGVIEDSCYNFCPQSETLDSGTWNKGNSSISANVAIAPNGFLTADKIVVAASNSQHYVYIVTNAPILGQTYLYSVYVKAAERTEAYIQIANASLSSGQNAVINLTNGTIPSQSGGFSTVDVGNGWWLVLKSYASNSVNSTIYISPSVGGAITNLGNGIDGIYAWGAQVVQGSTPRPYLRTTNRLNVPRLDYSRGTGEPELLIERASTNLALHSEDLNNALWVKNGITYNAGDFGVGLSNKICRLVENTTTGAHNTIFGISQASNTYTYSIYVKNFSGTRNLGLKWWTGTVDYGYVFNITNGTLAGVMDSKVAPVSQGIQNIGNGWYRCYIVVNNTVSDLQIMLCNGTAFGFTGNNTSGLYIYGAQLELGTTPTTYIPTQGTTVARPAETNYVDLWNNSLLNRTNWTLFWEGYLYDGQTTGMSLCLSDTSTATADSNQIGWFNLNTPFYNITNVRTNGTSNAANNSLNKFAIQYNNGTVNFYRNGANIWASQTVAVFDYRYLVLNSGGSIFTTDKISLFNRTLSNAECTTITT